MATSWNMSLKVALISAGVLSTAMILNLSFPALLEFLNCEIPHLWSIVVPWMKPPYLYLVLNCIILTLVASTKLQPPNSETDGFAIVSPLPIPISTVPEHLSFADQSPIKSAFEDVPVVSPVVEEAAAEVLEARPDEETVEAVVGIGEGVEAVDEVVITSNETENDEFVVSRSDCLPPLYPVEYSSVSTEKPLVSKRFGYRRSFKASPEGGKALLGVSKPKRQDTLESTWRMITEGRPMPLTRHLKKSETWDTQGLGTRNGDSPSAASPAPLMNKSETFHERATSNNSSLSPSSPGGGSGRLKREPSPSQDELNRRVEAFIRKFNEEMRLQRQESLKQYSQMVGGGGTH